MKKICAAVLALMVAFSSMAQRGGHFGGGHFGGGRFDHDGFRHGFWGPGFWPWWGVGVGVGLGLDWSYAPAWEPSYVYAAPAPVYVQPSYPVDGGLAYDPPPAPAPGTITMTGSPQFGYSSVPNASAPREPAVRVYVPANSYSYTPAPAPIPAKPAHTPVITVTRSKAGYLIYDNR